MSSEISNKDVRKSKRKSSSSSAKKAEGPELFVLPPHILQKLGINLGNIKDSGPNTIALPDAHDCALDSSVEPKRSRNPKVKNKKDVKKNSSESSTKSPNDKCSIMETANLMKKSVFLSPTFVTTDSIDRELEFSTVSTKDAVLCENDKGHNDVHISKGKKQARKAVPVNVANKKLEVPMPPKWNITIPAQLEKNDCDIGKVSTSETHVTKITITADNTIDATLIAENIIKDTKTNYNTTETDIGTCDHNSHHSEISAATDEHLDEAYLSDCSNSNLGAISAPISPMNTNKQKKVQIIHEEVFDLSTYNNLVRNVFSPDKGSLIPVPINSVVSVQAKISECLDSKEDLQPADQSLESDERFIEQICREVKSLDDININMLDVICNDNYVIDESMDTTKMQNINCENLILYVANDMPNQSVVEQIQKNSIKDTKSSDKEGTLKSVKELSSHKLVACNDAKEISDPNHERFQILLFESSEGSSTHTGVANDATNTCEDITDNKPLGDRHSSTKIITKEEVACYQKREATVHSVIDTPRIGQSDKVDGEELAKAYKIIEQSCLEGSENENQDKVDEIASYLSTYLQNRRLSLSQKTIKQYENSKKKIKCQSTMDKKKVLTDNKMELAPSNDIDLALNTTLRIKYTQSVEESRMWLNQEFGKLSYNASTNNHDDVYYWGEKSSGTCEDIFVVEDYVEYITSGINENNEATEALGAVTETETAVSEDNNPVVVIMAEPEPAPSSTRDQEALVDVKPTENMNQTLCSTKEETNVSPENTTQQQKSNGSNENQKNNSLRSKTTENSVLKSPIVPEKEIVTPPAAVQNKRISKSKKEDATPSIIPVALGQSPESVQETHKTKEPTSTPTTPPSLIEDSCPSSAHGAEDAAKQVVVGGRKRRSRRIISSSDEGANDAGDPSYISETATSVQDSKPSRQSARRSSKRLRSTLADYSSSDEVLEEKTLRELPKKKPAINLDSSTVPKKRGRKRKNNIIEEAAPPTHDSHKLSGDCNHNETAVASDTNYDLNDMKLNTTDVKQNTSDVKLNTSDVKLNTSDVKLDRNKSCDSVEVECDVCNERLPNEDWIDHIAKKHLYLAWKKGDTPVDLQDPGAVQKFLTTMSKEIGGFICYKCGDKRKYPQVYRKHVELCSKEVSDIKISGKPAYSPRLAGGRLACAQCGQAVAPDAWREHSLSLHYNLAWPVGGEPINIRSPVDVTKYLKEYASQGYELQCKLCGAARASLLGLYAHILTCGKTAQEVDEVMDHCEICDKKYLCIYKTQHENAHRDKLANELRRAQIEHAKREQEETEHAQADHADDDSAPAGRRRKAAEKARTVIQELEEAKSKNIQSSAKSESDSEGSDAVVPDESEESDSDVDSNASMVEDDDEARRSHKAIGATVFPFKCQNVEEYAKRGYKDFCTTHYSKKSVFPEWVPCYTFLSNEPPEELNLLDVSCQVKLFNNNWKTFRKFEGFFAPVQGMFLGAAPSCLAWAPPREHSGRGGSWLAVACFSGPDAPRLLPAEPSAAPALLQIWNFNEFHGTPKLSLGIVLPAAAWAMSWCPIGGAGGEAGGAGGKAGGAGGEAGGAGGEAGGTGGDAGGGAERLGLLAVTCADGGAYIYCVPQPDSKQDRPKFCKLKPVGELRLSASAERKRVHATAIHWSMQKGNSQIMVGYADGLVAHFDLESSSPLTRLEERGTRVCLPYHQERAQAGCITGVCYLASSEEGAGVAGASSTTGSVVAAGAGAGAGGAARTVLVAPSAHAQFIPGWGSMVVTTDDMSVSELNVWGGGRSLRMQRPLAVCARCACAASASGARLRCLSTLPQHSYIKNARHNVLNIEMVPLQPPSKRIKQTGNTDQEMKIEPLTYEAAVAEYGVQVASTKKKQNFTTSERDDHCERFPLADMTALAFCPAARHHGRLAVAAHAGLLLVVHAHARS